MGYAISFVNNKGGVGKTTSAVNIGLGFAQMGKKVLFVDLDSQANLTSVISGTDALEQKWESTLEDAFIAGKDEPLPIHHTDDPNVDFIPTDLDLANFEKDTSRISFRELLLLDLLQDVKKDYDYIIIDCPPNLSTITYNAMTASDYMVLVTHPEGSSMKGLEMIISLYNEVRSNPRLNPDLKIIGCLVNKIEKDKVSSYHIDLINNNFGELVLPTFIPKSTKVSQATSFAKSIYEMDPQGRIAEAYAKITQELHVRICEDQLHAGKK